MAETQIRQKAIITLTESGADELEISLKFEPGIPNKPHTPGQVEIAAVAILEMLTGRAERVTRPLGPKDRGRR